MHQNAAVGRALLALFIASGFAGLVYQSVWSHYLGLVLGHAAFAQTLVLAIFMGGMALGAWLISRRMTRWRHLLLGYAVIEGLIGLLGLVFHSTFVAYVGLAQGSILPALGGSFLAGLFQWLSAALIILPQSVLLGATFPLLSGSYLRAEPERQGHVLGGLYFANSIGAAGGALLTTFWLLPLVGMPGAMMTAGLVNVLVAIGAWALWKATRTGEEASGTSTPVELVARERSDPALSRLSRVMLGATFLSGAFSFMYEIGWIRMLNQALGTTMHSFELMLAAFIAGLAFGGAWIRQRDTRIVDAVAYAAVAQVLMGIAALLSIIALSNSFAWVGWMMSALAQTESGYTLFSVGSASVALIVMFPAAFFAGMTLPLFTMALLRKGATEQAIGRVYAANTVGAIVGILVVVHFLIPMIGVRLAVTLAALGDAILGILLLRYFAERSWRVAASVCGLLVAGALVVSLQFGNVDPRVQSSGVFRHGNAGLDEGAEVRYLKDGKSSTVSFYTVPLANGKAMGIVATNGKPDAALALEMNQRATADEPTMILMPALALASHSDPKDVAVIGWGSGLTSHSVLGTTAVKRLDNIEIEPAMIDAARLYRGRVDRAYSDPRSRIIIDDARSFFAKSQHDYDLILSEPSNPWVSGVSSLFTEQFYSIAAARLREGGVFLQWLQVYELNDKLFAEMLGALRKRFQHIEAYVTNSSDLIILASVDRPLPALDWKRIDIEPLRSELARIDIRSLADLNTRKIANTTLIDAFLAAVPHRVHSDYFPSVALEAPRARYLRTSASGLSGIGISVVPLLEMIGVRGASPLGEVTPSNLNVMTQAHRVAHLLKESLQLSRVPTNLQVSFSEFGRLAQTLISIKQSVESINTRMFSDLLTDVSSPMLTELPPEDGAGLWTAEAAWLRGGVVVPPAITAHLAALDAASQRDASAMLQSASAALEQHYESLGNKARDQLLLIALTGALELGRIDAASMLLGDFGSRIPAQPETEMTRRILVALFNARSVDYDAAR